MTEFHPGAFWLAYGLGLAKSSAGAVDLWGHEGNGHGTHTDALARSARAHHGRDELERRRARR